MALSATCTGLVLKPVIGDANTRHLLASWTKKSSTDNYTLTGYTITWWWKDFNGQGHYETANVSAPNNSADYTFPDNARAANFYVRPEYRRKSDNNDVSGTWSSWWNKKDYIWGSLPTPDVPTVTETDSSNTSSNRFILSVTYDFANSGTASTRANTIKFALQIHNEATNTYSLVDYFAQVPDVSNWLRPVSIAVDVPVGCGFQVKCRAERRSSLVESDPAVGRQYVSEYSSMSDIVYTAPLSISLASVVALSATSARLTWTPAYASAATTYTIRYATTQNDLLIESRRNEVTTSGNVGTYVLNDLNAGAEYYVQISVNRYSKSSAFSEPVLLTLGAKPAAPTGWTNKSSFVHGDSVIFNWIHNAADNARASKSQIKIENETGTAAFVVNVNHQETRPVAKQGDDYVETSTTPIGYDIYGYPVAGAVSDNGRPVFAVTPYEETDILLKYRESGTLVSGAKTDKGNPVYRNGNVYYCGTDVQYRVIMHTYPSGSPIYYAIVEKSAATSAENTHEYTMSTMDAFNSGVPLTLDWSNVPYADGSSYTFDELFARYRQTETYQHGTIDYPVYRIKNEFNLSKYMPFEYLYVDEQGRLNNLVRCVTVNTAAAFVTLAGETVTELADYVSHLTGFEQSTAVDTFRGVYEVVTNGVPSWYSRVIRGTNAGKYKPVVFDEYVLAVLGDTVYRDYDTVALNAGVSSIGNVYVSGYSNNEILLFSPYTSFGITELRKISGLADSKISNEVASRTSSDIQLGYKTSEGYNIYQQPSGVLYALVDFGVTIRWSVRTLGVQFTANEEDSFSDWSVARELRLYQTPSVLLSVSDADASETVEYPIRIQALASPNDSSQNPVSYAFSIVTNSSYEQIGVGGETLISENSEIYHRVIDSVDSECILELQPNDAPLHRDMSYTIICIVAFSSGLTATQSQTFTVVFGESPMTVDAETITYPAQCAVGINVSCYGYERSYYQVTYQNGIYTRTSTQLTGSVIGEMHYDTYYTESNEATAPTNPTRLTGVTTASYDWPVYYTGTTNRTYYCYDTTNSKWYLATERQSLAVTVDDGEVVYKRTDVASTVYYVVNDEPSSALLPSENLLISVYRLNYDGTYELISDGVQNGSTVLDPHPLLSEASYRVLATDAYTGDTVITDMTFSPDYGKDEYGVPIKYSAIFNWNETWNALPDQPESDQASWSGNMLKIPFDVTENETYAPDVSLAEYVGRAHPVSYYGTHKGQSATWTAQFPKYDTDRLRLVRKLANYMGDVYVRGPHGTGYWANVTVSYDITSGELVIPVTFSIKQVEGGL